MDVAWKKRMILAFVLILFMLISITALFFCVKRDKVYAADNWVYLNNISGNYVIQSTSLDYYGKELDIHGGRTSTDNTDAPYVVLYNSSNLPQANHRFTFVPIETIGGKMVYGITSVIDNNGRLDVKGGQFVDGQPVWFFKGSDQNASQRWFVKTNDGGETVQIELAADTSLALGVGEEELNGNKILSLTTDKTESTSKWRLKPLAGTFGIDTKTYVTADNTGYESTDNEMSRYLDPLSDSSKSKISDIISIGVSGDGVQKTEYNGVTAFSVPYSSKFYINTSFNYANACYSEWTRSLPLGKKTNSQGSNLEWMVSSDSYKIKLSDGSEHQVGIGSILIEVSEDNTNWEKYKMFSFASDKKEDIWELNGEYIADGKYIRVSYLFEIFTHWTTFERKWYNHLLFGIPIGGQTINHYEYKNVKEMSDTFFVSVDGFSEGGDFGPVTVKNLSAGNGEQYEFEGFSKEEIKIAETLTDGSQTVTGFEIRSLFENAYRIEVAKNDGKFSVVQPGYTTTDSGRYQIRVTSRFGQEKTITVYVCAGDITQTYFGKAFASAPEEEAMICGTRLFSGTDDYLKSIGLHTTYAWAQVPVYVKGCSLKIKDMTNMVPLSGSVSYEGTEENGEIHIPLQTAAVEITLLTPGYYTVNLSTSNTDGDIIRFSACFWVVEEETGPEINKQLLYELSHKTYDLIPVYYSVDMPRGPYTYINEAGEAVEKQGILRYAFSTYSAALNFSVRLQKEYTYRLDNGMFKYLNSDSPNALFDEYEIFDEMYKVAKENVKLNYFSSENTLTMTGTDDKCIISDRGYIYYIGEETFNGDAANVAPIVALNKEEREALTSRKGFLNDFTFVSMPLDSAEVTLFSDKGEEYRIEYNIPVGEQLKKMGAESGDYKIVETSIFGAQTEYYGTYVDESDQSSIVVDLQIGDKQVAIDITDNGKTFTCTGGFMIEGAKDSIDDHGLICVIYERSETPMDIYGLTETKFHKKGTYKVKVEDRFGRSYQFNIIVK